ncbi:class F sortase [Pseudonocardia nigra]|uniref:class F sortase n=1 Tax=Pseudonocardia nigra TaxID=1921578 RepID=UPI001C5DA568|nr:class F sortase [Pseudonocardia nigra]
MPAVLSLPEQDVTARVRPSATAPNGELAVPTDPSLLGWWVGGARPGEAAGTTVLAGHVDSAEAGLGAFAALRDVEGGDRVEIAAADGTVRAFVVTDVTRYGKAQLPRELFTRDGPPLLALITCTGEFDRDRGSYTDNLVVLATPA